MNWILKDRATVPAGSEQVTEACSVASPWPPATRRVRPRPQESGAEPTRATPVAPAVRCADNPPAVPAAVGTAACPSGVIVCTWSQLRQLGDTLSASAHLAPTRDALQIIVVPGGTREDGESAASAEAGASLDLTRLDPQRLERAVADCPRDGLYRPTTLVEGELELDPHDRVAWRRGRPILLSRTEFRILYALMRCRGAVLSRSQLLAMVWTRPTVEARTIDVHIRRLRQALNGPGEPDLIRTVRGLGYALQ